MEYVDSSLICYRNDWHALLNNAYGYKAIIHIYITCFFFSDDGANKKWVTDQYSEANAVEVIGFCRNAGFDTAWQKARNVSIPVVFRPIFIFGRN